MLTNMDYMRVAIYCSVITLQIDTVDLNSGKLHTNFIDPQLKVVPQNNLSH